MAKPAEIEVTLNTAQAIKDAKAFGPKLEKALSVNPSGNQYLEKQQELIKENLKYADLLTKNGGLKKGFTTKGLDEYEEKFRRATELAKEYEQIEKDIAKTQEDSATLKSQLPSMRGKIGGAKGEENRAAAKEAYEAAKIELQKQVDLEAQLKEKQAAVVAEFQAEYDKVKYITSAMDKVKTASAENQQSVEGISATYDALVDKTKQEAVNTDQATASTQGLSDAADKTAQSEQAAAEAAKEYTEEKRKQESAASAPDASTRQVAEQNNETKETISSLITEIVRCKNALESLQAAEQDTTATEEQLAAASEKLDEKLSLDTGKASIFELTKYISDLSSGLKTIKTLGMPSNMSEEFNRMTEATIQAKQGVREYEKSFRAVPAETKKASKSSNDFGKSVKTAADVAKKGLSGLTGMIKSVKSGFKALSRSSGGVKSSFDGMARSMRSNFKHMITSITKYVLGFRSLFFLVRRLRKYIGEGIQNMAKFNDGSNHVNESITRLLSSLLFLKNAWATAFSPILQFVTPWLEALIDKLAEVGNAVSRFIGSLLGQSTVFQAVKVKASDYAGSLDKVGGSAGGAADKTKKLTDRLAAFDDLNILGVDSDPDGTGSGGGGGSSDVYEPNANDMFKLVQVADTVKQKLLDMWDAGDFTELGKTLGDKIIDAFTNIPWEDIKTNAYKVGRSIITFLNGAFEDGTIWEEAGHALAEGLNTITEFAFGFLLNDTTDFGGGVAKLINKFFADTDWDTVRSNISLFVQALRDNVVSFLQGLNWEGDEGIFEAFRKFGMAIGKALSITLGDAEFMSSLGEALGKLISSIIISWKAILDENSGDDIGNAIYEFFKSLFNSINWEDLAKDLSGSLILILNAISRFSEELSQDDTFQQSLSDFVENLNLDTVFEALGRNISSSVVAANAIGSALASTLANKDVANAVVNGINSLLSNLDIGAMLSSTIEFLGNLIGSALADPFLPIKLAWAIVEGLSKALFNAFNSWFEGGADFAEQNMGMESADTIGGYIIQGFLGGITKSLQEEPLIKFINENIVIPFVNAICDLFDMHSPSKVSEEWGEWIVQGLYNGIDRIVDTLIKPFTDLHASLSQKWQDIKDTAFTKFTLMRVAILEVFNTLKETLKTPINGILSFIESMINGVIRGINKAINAINTFTSGMTFPDWLKDVPGASSLAGKGLNFNLKTLSEVSLPRLAQGAVIPPNREFMAVLGDQSHGTNVEAPLDTIKQAVAEVLANNGNAEVIQLLQQLIAVVESKNLIIGDKEIGKANARYVSQQQIVRGSGW